MSLINLKGTSRLADVTCQHIDLSGNLDVSNNASVGGTFGVMGTTSFIGNVGMSGTLNVLNESTFGGMITGNIIGNAATVTNGVYTSGDQTIGGVKTFSSTILGNAATVTNGVYTSGDQTIGGVKTFSSTISGNAATVTNGVYTSGDQTIGGVKTFSSTILGNAATVTNGVYTSGDQTIDGVKTFTSTILGNAATVTGGVYTSGNQTIDGVKTFSSTITGSITGNAATVTGGVYTSGDQTINGVKTFSSDVKITGGSPTLYFKDTNERSGMIHMNSNRMYFLSGGVNSDTWGQVNGQWPLYLQTNTNEAFFGGNINTPGEVAGNILRVNMPDSKYWQLQDYNDENLGFFQNGTLKGFIEDDGGQLVNRMNFTGQHRCFIKDIPFSNTDYEGRIICADQNIYISMSNTIKKGNQAITQNESLPYVSLSNKTKDKSCFGVISFSEDPNERIDRYGAFSTPYEKEKGDTRVYINSVGEGAIWVSNKNGTLESGDYITTCDLSGYGTKQDDDILHNYTVAKITMDCDFSPHYVPIPSILKDASGENILDAYNQLQWTDASGEYEYEYNIRYINREAQIITYEEYDSSYDSIVAYVGCTYHCG
jgi:hypothetical protein